MDNIPWSIARINAPFLWKRGILGHGVVVAVIDTGVNASHPDLCHRIWQGSYLWEGNGYNAIEHSRDIHDEIGHGTACAGTIAGDGSAGIRTGVAPQASIMPVKVFGPHGTTQAIVRDGISWAARNGADIIALSLSFNRHQQPEYRKWREAADVLLTAGIPLICSAGNLGSRMDEFPVPNNIPLPGSIPPPWLHPLQRTNDVRTGGAITCGASDRRDTPLCSPDEGSGTGPATWEDISPYNDYPLSDGRAGLVKPDLLAPGEDIISLSHEHEGYIRYGHTSSAVPHVAGAAALLLSAFPRLTPAELNEALETTAIHPMPGMKDNRYGAGRIDVEGAYRYLALRHCDRI